jgi:hypothetical protein
MPRQGGAVQPRRYPPRWLNLAEARAKLLAKGFAPPEAEDQLHRTIGDEALRFRLNHGDLHIGYLTSTMGQSWRRNPKLDFERSTIVVPLPRRPPPMSETQKTLAMVAQLYEPPAPPIIDEVPIVIEVLAEDLDRLWPDDPAPEAAPPASKQQPAAGAKPQLRRRGPHPDKQDRVQAQLEEEIRSGKTTLDQIRSWTQVQLARHCKAPRSTAHRGRKQLLSKYDQV